MCAGVCRCGRKPGEHCECSTILGSLIRPCLLLLIAEGEGRHGYELAPALAELGVNVDTESGRVYRVLRHLEREGLVESAWDTQATGAARRVYRVTGAGRAALDEVIASVGGAIEVLTRLQTRLQEWREKDTEV